MLLRETDRKAYGTTTNDLETVDFRFLWVSKRHYEMTSRINCQSIFAHKPLNKAHEFLGQHGLPALDIDLHKRERAIRLRYSAVHSGQIPIQFNAKEYIFLVLPTLVASSNAFFKTLGYKFIIFLSRKSLREELLSFEYSLANRITIQRANSRNSRQCARPSKRKLEYRLVRSTRLNAITHFTRKAHFKWNSRYRSRLRAV